ncbi:MAG: sensor histidine kinase [Christensenellales bacterium]
MKKKIFVRVFCLAVAIIAVMFCVGVLAVNLNAKSMIKDRLQRETDLVCALIKDNDDFSSFDGFRGDDAFRITVLDATGQVLYESDTDSKLESHADREEVVNALAGTPTSVERYSQTFGCKMTYYAQKTTLQDGETIVVRLAVKSDTVDDYMAVAVPIMLAVVVLAIIASAVIARVIADRFSSKVTEIGLSLKSLEEGEYKPIVTDSKEPELYMVLSKINELSSSIEQSVNKTKQEHRKLNIVLDNVAQGIIAVGNDGKIVFANKSACELFGQQSVADKDLVYLVDDVKLLESIRNGFEEEKSFEYPYHDKWLAVATKKIKDKELIGIVAGVVIITDVTLQKQAATMRSEFFANASHELKTPVTAMQGLSELMISKQTLDESSQKQVERIYKESTRLSTLIGDMLKLSQYERGEDSTASLVKVDLRQVAQEAVAELAESMGKKGVVATIQGEGCVEGDYKKIYELVENLCSNAVNYNVEGGRINVDIGDSDDEVRLTVSDTGIGIEQEHIPRLCERFYRVDKSRSKKTGGTGLGLAIVKHICALYDADLHIASKVGEGTTVTVTFPQNIKK